uniref:Rho guanine nucleotide exchange factor (GEF) 16 n=1 Tax=Oryzias sinensis TaxID=183150 RepID=A0A8C7XSN3_9TELE
MSQSESNNGNQAPALLESQLATELHISEPGDEYFQAEASPTPSGEPATLEEDRDDRITEPHEVVLSTESRAVQKMGTHQLIPKTLASRPKNRYHTTVVTFPVRLEKSSGDSSGESHSRHSAQVPDVPWEDYDSDGDGCDLRRNRRNRSYRAAVTSLDVEAMMGAERAWILALLLFPFQRTLGRKKDHRGSFKDATPCLYQEMRERGLHSTNQDELLDDFVVVETPVEDQGIVVKNYKPAQLTWSQLPQITLLSKSLHSFLFRGDICKVFNSKIFKFFFLTHSLSYIFFYLERRHQEDVVIRDISDIIQNHAAHHFEPYIAYCSNETFQQRTHQKLLNTNSAFKEALKQLESSSECGGLPMFSFLILPMQRVTRLPLLLDTICQKTPENTAEYFAAVWALHAMSKLVTSCNDGARRMERTEQMYTIQKQMDFGKIKPFPLVSSSRWLKKRGELNISAEELSIWRAFTNRSYYLFLFNDVLIVTKKKTEEIFVVLDYATLENVEVEYVMETDGQMSSPTKSTPLTFKLLMTKNSDGRSEQISLVADSRVDRARWIIALTEHKQANATCTEGLPQYEATKSYIPKEPDEIGLRQAELVLVMKKEEAWCYAERMRDGERGWFPASCATEITNPTAMESNVQQMKRLRKETNV